ncbi:MAG: TetR/AcrR family transcriptional regulator [Saprospiraceae bacterium]|nr:TetR/AcrR family transcriptional regulator [Saprospiraceae bacterium]
METTTRLTRKERIYQEAARLFRDKGYRATSMRDLADSVGLEPSSLYSHISSKQELLHKICFDCGQRFLSGMEEVLQTAESPTEALEQLIRLHVTIASEDVTAITVFNDEWRHLEQPELDDFLRMRRGYEEQFELVVTEGMQTGQFRQLEPKMALNTLLSAVQWVYRKKQINGDEVERIAAGIAEMLLNGLNTKS